MKCRKFPLLGIWEGATFKFCKNNRTEMRLRWLVCNFRCINKDKCKFVLSNFTLFFCFYSIGKNPEDRSLVHRHWCQWVNTYVGPWLCIAITWSVVLMMMMMMVMIVIIISSTFCFRMEGSCMLKILLIKLLKEVLFHQGKCLKFWVRMDYLVKESWVEFKNILVYQCRGFAGFIYLFQLQSEAWRLIGSSQFWLLLKL